MNTPFAGLYLKVMKVLATGGRDVRASEDLAISLGRLLDTADELVCIQSTSRQAVEYSDGDVITHITEYLYRYAGNELAKNESIPLAWPKVVRRYQVFDRYGPRGMKEVPENSPWDLLELSLIIPIISKPKEGT